MLGEDLSVLVLEVVGQVHHFRLERDEGVDVLVGQNCIRVLIGFIFLNAEHLFDSFELVVELFYLFLDLVNCKFVPGISWLGGRLHWLSDYWHGCCLSRLHNGIS